MNQIRVIRIIINLVIGKILGDFIQIFPFALYFITAC